MATVKSFKADVSSVCPSSERLEELWVVCVCVCLYAENGATLWWENNDGKQEKLVEWKAVVDSAGIKTAD